MAAIPIQGILPLSWFERTRDNLAPNGLPEIALPETGQGATGRLVEGRSDCASYAARAMGSRETRHRTLVRACTIAGDETVLARHLDAPVETVVEWLIGALPVPLDKFLLAVDIVLAHKAEQIRRRQFRIEQLQQDYDWD
jgi:hypothetical protein